jgi:hypothetical protein
MTESSTNELSVFQMKYNEFADDLIGALPEYTLQIQAAKSLDSNVRLSRFQEEVKTTSTFEGNTDDIEKNPRNVLPGVEISDSVWATLSNNTKKAIWEYVRILSICCLMEAGFGENSKPSWMDDAMNDMKQKLEGIDFQGIINKFMTFLKPGGEGGSKTSEGGEIPEGLPGGFEKLFENGFPKIPEKFLKGHMAKLAQEIVKDITPEDLGLTPEMIAECEKNPSRAFEVLFQVFGNNPGNIQKTIQKVGKRLQQKFMSGAIRPQEIAREAEELMKEFANNSSFVDMMDGIKGAFGFTDMDVAKQAGREGSARLAMVKERLKKKASEKEAKKTASQNVVVNSTTTMTADMMAAQLLMEETKNKTSKVKKMSGKGDKK